MKGSLSFLGVTLKFLKYVLHILYLICHNIKPYLLHVVPYSKITMYMYCVHMYSTFQGYNIVGAATPLFPVSTPLSCTEALSLLD